MNFLNSYTTVQSTINMSVFNCKQYFQENQNIRTQIIDFVSLMLYFCVLYDVICYPVDRTSFDMEKHFKIEGSNDFDMK